MAETYDRDSMSSRLMEHLARIDFGRRYFEYYEGIRTRAESGKYATDRKELAAILAETGLEFKYFTKERFFRYTEKHPGFDLMLHVVFRYSTVEFMLYAEGDWGVVGGPWPKLAREVIQATDPDFNPYPPYPKLPFSNAAELREVVSFGSALFSEARDFMTSCDG